MKGYVIISIAAFLPVACSTTNKGPLLQHSALPAHELVTTDSTSRIIAESRLSVFSTTGSVDPKRIICTEPSPDVATSLANSLGFGLTVKDKGGLSLSKEQVQGIVQLGERTAAIQLLRDKMYQTCLAYSNGAISGTTYSLIMSRLDDSIVTLSLGDGAAGAFGRNLAAIGTEASASAETTLSGLTGQIATIDEQSQKLAEANKRVDEAQSALTAHQATKPADDKKSEYEEQTKKLNKDLQTAKAERDALLELMQSMLKSSSEATGKITEIKAGGGLTARPDAAVLHEMQGEFLLNDVNKDIIFTCLVELGMRSSPPVALQNKNNQQNNPKKPNAAENPAAQQLTGNQHVEKLIGHFETMLTKKINQTTATKPGDPPINELALGEAGTNYAGIVLRERDTALAAYCRQNLDSLITKASDNFNKYRIERTKLNAQNNASRHSAEIAKANVREKELIQESIKLCNDTFKDNEPRKNACLDQFIPIKSSSDKNAPKKN